MRQDRTEGRCESDKWSGRIQRLPRREGCRLGSDAIDDFLMNMRRITAGSGCIRVRPDMGVQSIEILRHAKL